MTATQTAQVAERTVDWNRLYLMFNQMPGNIAGFDRRGNPMTAGGRAVPIRQTERFILQDGFIFDAAGKIAEKVPKAIRDQVEEMRGERPSPGITHEGKVRPCPVPGCTFRTTREEFYREHKRLHKDIGPQQWAQLEGRGGSAPLKLNLSDFANPQEMMEQFTEGAGASPPEHESPQGEG